MDQQTINVHECNSGLGRQQNCEGIRFSYNVKQRLFLWIYGSFDIHQ